MKTNMKKLILLNLLTILLLFSFVSCDNQSKKPIKNDPPESSLISKSSKYLNYEYTLMEKDNKTVVVFPNFLPRNDNIVVGAIKYFILEIYNETIPETSKPTLENRNGVNLIKVNGDKSNYYVQINKEDTGEINSFTMWGELQ